MVPQMPRLHVELHHPILAGQPQQLAELQLPQLLDVHRPALQHKLIRLKIELVARGSVGRCWRRQCSPQGSVQSGLPTG